MRLLPAAAGAQRACLANICERRMSGRRFVMWWSLGGTAEERISGDGLLKWVGGWVADVRARATRGLRGSDRWGAKLAMKGCAFSPSQKTRRSRPNKHWSRPNVHFPRQTFTKPENITVDLTQIFHSDKFEFTAVQSIFARVQSTHSAVQKIGRAKCSFWCAKNTSPL